MRKERSLGSWGPPAPLKRETASPPLLIPALTTEPQEPVEGRQVLGEGCLHLELLKRFCSMVFPLKLSFAEWLLQHTWAHGSWGSLTEVIPFLREPQQMNFFSIFVPTGSSAKAPKHTLHFFLFKNVALFFSGYYPFTWLWPRSHGEGLCWWRVPRGRCRPWPAPGSTWSKASCQTAAHHRRHVPYLYDAVGPTGHHQSPSNVHGHVGNVMFSFMKGC